MRVLMICFSLSIACKFFSQFGCGGSQRLDYLVGTVANKHVFPITWSECGDCCSDLHRVAANSADIEPNIICFDVNFHSRKQQYYAQLSPFDPAFSFYLGMAQKFLVDVGTKVKLRRRIVWRIEDDATIRPVTVHEFKRTASAVVGHSVHNLRGNVSSYTTLFPNFHFIQSKGYHNISSHLDSSIGIPYDKRHPKVFWAGSTTGELREGLRTSENPCDDLIRVNLVRQFQKVRWLSLILTHLVQGCEGHESAYTAEGILQKHVPEERWALYRGVIDIDGNVDAWGLVWRLASGSVVFRVKSSYSSYISKWIIDGVHYIGLSADLSDLEEKTSIVKSSRSKDVIFLKQIANNARMLMKNQFQYSRVVSDIATLLALECP